MSERLAVAGATLVAGLGVGGPAMENASAEAFQSPAALTAQPFNRGPEAQAASNGNHVFMWEVVSGAPLKQGGVHSRGETRSFLKSAKGHRAMHAEGFNSAEVSALEHGTISSCHIDSGKNLGTMVSSAGGGGLDVERNVVLDAAKYPNGLSGFCVRAVRNLKGHKKEILTETVAGPCANILGGHKKVTTEAHTSTRPEVKLVKVAEDSAKHVIPTPTGIFKFKMECTGANGKKITREVLYMGSMVVSRKCKPGKNVSMTELPALGPDTWKNLTPLTQNTTMKRKGVRFVFKNMEVAETPPPQPKCVPNETQTVNEQGQCVPKPKDGNPGAGSGTNTQTTPDNTGVGGPGAGGSPDTTGSNGNFCRNPQTGDVQSGNPDQMGYCN